MIISGTGHRLPRLGGYHLESTLDEFILQQLNSMREDIDHVISGGANGLDQAISMAAIALSIPTTLYLPFDGFGRNWPASARKRLSYISERSGSVVISPGPYSNQKYVARDYAMVNSCDMVLALFDGKKNGGTWITVSYAQEKGVKIINVFDEWRKWASPWGN